MGPWPKFLQPHIVERDDKVAEKECIKLAKVRKRGYVRMEEVKSLTYLFLVLKGEDIRIIYNGTSRGLSSYLWAPQFALPTVGSTIWAVERGTFMADQYIGEMFLKFTLSEEIRLFYGVNTVNVRIEQEWEKTQGQRLGNLGVEDDGAYILALSCLASSDMGKVHSHGRATKIK